MRTETASILAACALLVACSHDFGFLDALGGESGDGGGVDANLGSDGSSPTDAASDGGAPHDGATSDGPSTNDGGSPPDGGGPQDAANDHNPPPPDAGGGDASTLTDGGYLACGKIAKGCNPMTNEGCPTGQHCYWANTGTYACTSDNGNKVWPSTCADFTECAAGYDCFTGQGALRCEKNCCGNADCPSGTACQAWDVAGLCN